MNILHVEDDIDWCKRTVHPALKAKGLVNIFHAESYAKSIVALGANQIDYVVLDLSIPHNDLTEASDITHGLNLAQHIRTNFPGMPILILTGQSTDEAVEKFEDDNDFTIFWDGVERPLFKVRKKRKLPDVIKLLEKSASDLDKIDGIELNLFDGLQLDCIQKRIIKLFCKDSHALAAKVYPLHAGLSSSRVVSVVLINNQDREFHFALAKIDTYQKVDVDCSNFRSHIQKLPVGSFPTLLNQYFAGCGETKGVFYQFANKYKSDYFTCLLASDGKALNILKIVKTFFRNWFQTSVIEQSTVGNIRRLLCSDDKLSKFDGFLSHLDIGGFEKKCLPVRFSTQHGDLHGKNILVSEDCIPIIIDYGDVKKAPSALDSVTLELSPFFHPSIRNINDVSLDIAENWFDDDVYFNLSMFPQSSAFLRQWGKENAFMNRDYVTVVYTYAIRQLTYKDSSRKRRYLGRYFAHPMMQNRRAKRDDYKPSAVRVTQRYVP
ncbi:Response regulator receiver domain protein (plasmid) [Piscirickettsia salmonis]|uniref:Phosphotransferase enzyme family protein n=2 Tax=Piscirickettsia salmonis TaxID=1238 RepID=A0AAC8VLD1_PISSA|nr:response regulator [Piscirickettsia salmonis]ALB24668.1 phosphotransferase enzyme family protein [Piscirickettsia salmonis]ALT18842.1 hypothetical protein PSLF89_08340 [Piscirickettsia salmonis LF-89 = ATCC VR-1361]ALY04534.1 hypothetical protein AWE47_16640 [Piscirickettsia salmonis]AMA43901.1 hypothetical protein AWJ11_16050 [Piscirickettsia salmonis]AOS37119.1 hypothetical protein AVM72_17380 [Piscirickettsia salmonis]